VLHRSGFTLIELVVSVGIILMMVAVSLPAFLNFQRRQDMTNATQQLRDGILDTQNYALAPRADIDGGPEKVAGADYYRIVFYNDGNTAKYEIDEQTRDLSGQTVNTLASGYPTYPTSAYWTPIATRSLPTNISFCRLSDDNLTTTTTPVTADRIKGIVYSISQMGRIVAPSQTGTYTLTIQSGATGKQSAIKVQAETGRIDVAIDTPVVACN
jgi:prepilin-type N-terminal cleavage/methylation domain-containing protein